MNHIHMHMSVNHNRLSPLQAWHEDMHAACTTAHLLALLGQLLISHVQPEMLLCRVRQAPHPQVGPEDFPVCDALWQVHMEDCQQLSAMLLWLHWNTCCSIPCVRSVIRYKHNGHSNSSKP